MTTIIAGMFDTVDKAEGAMGKLLNAEFGEQRCLLFCQQSAGTARHPIDGRRRR
jgi:hypothetical protein